MVVVLIKIKRQKNSLILEVCEKRDYEESTNVVSFNTLQFDALLKLFHGRRELDANHRELYRFLIHQLDQIRQREDEYFSSSIEQSLDLILNYELITEDYEHLLFVEDLDNDDRQLLSYIRVFLFTYNPKIDATDDYKHQFYLKIIKILIKFTIFDDKFLSYLLDNSIFERILAIVRYIFEYYDENEVTSNASETLSYSLYLIFKLSTQDGYIEAGNGSLIKFKLLLINYLEAVINGTVRSYEGFSESIKISSLLCLFNGPLTKSNQLNERFTAPFVEGINKIMDDLVYKKLRIMLIQRDSEIVDHEFIKYFHLFDVFKSFRNFVDFRNTDSQLLHHIEKILINESNDKYTNWVKNAQKRLSFESSGEHSDSQNALNSIQSMNEDTNILIMDLLKAYKTTGNLNMKKLNQYFMLSKTYEFKFDELVNMLIKCLNNSTENAEKLYVLSQKFNYLEKFIEILDLHQSSVETRECLLFLISKIYLRRFILDNDTKKLYANKIMSLFAKKGKPSHELIFIFEAYFNEEKITPEIIKRIVIKLQYLAHNIHKANDIFVLNTFEAYEILTDFLNRNLNNNLIEAIRVEFFDKKCAQSMYAELRRKYEMYGREGKLEQLCDLKSILELVQSLIKKYYNLFEIDKTLRVFLQDFKIEENEHVNLNPIVSDILASISVVNKNDQNEMKAAAIELDVQSLCDSYKKEQRVDVKKLIAIFSSVELMQYLDNNVQLAFKQLANCLIDSLNNFHPGSEILYQQEQEQAQAHQQQFDFIDSFIDVVLFLVNTKKLLTDPIVFMLFIIMFKIQLRRSVLGYKNRQLPEQLVDILAGIVESKSSNEYVTMMLCYFRRQQNAELNKFLPPLVHSPTNFGRFERSQMSMFEIYTYFNHYITQTTSNAENLSQGFITEFFDKKCFEAMATDFARKYDAYKRENQLEQLFELKSMLDLTQNLLDMAMFTHGSRFQHMCLQILNDFKPPENDYINFKSVVEKISALYKKAQSIATDQESSKAKNEQLEKAKIGQIEEQVVNLMKIANFDNYENTRLHYEQIMASLNIIIQNLSVINENLVIRMEELNINKLFYHLCRFYLEFSRQNTFCTTAEQNIEDSLPLDFADNSKIELIPNFHEMLEMILCILIKLSEFTVFTINSYQNHNMADCFIDTLDILINMLMLDRILLLSENVRNHKLVRLFMHLLLKLSASQASSDIIKIKFQKFNIHIDLLQRLTFFKKYGCSNLVNLLISNSFDKAIYSKLVFQGDYIVNNSVISLLKVYFKQFLYSIHDAFTISKQLDYTGSLQYELTPSLGAYDDTVERYENLSVVINCLCNFIVIDSVHLKYLCYLCTEDVQYLNMFIKLVLRSINENEKLAAIRVLWLLIANRTIAKKIRNDKILMEFLKESSNTHSMLQIRTYSGAILWNIMSKFENKSMMITNGKRRESGDDDSDNGLDMIDGTRKSLTKLSIQATQDYDNR